MINEKNLDDWEHNTFRVMRVPMMRKVEPGQKLEPEAFDDHDFKELIRLARKGLWTEKQLVPYLESMKEKGQDVKIFKSWVSSLGPKMRFEQSLSAWALEALAALPKDKA